MPVNIGRRKSIAALGGSAACPFVARAQQPGRPPTIGFFSPNTSSAQMQWDQIKSLGGKLELEVSTLQVRRTEDIASAFAVLKDHPDVLNVCGDPLITTNQVRIIE